MKTRIAYTVLATAGLAIGACANIHQPIYNAENVPVTTTSGKSLSQGQVRQAIITAGTSLGWRMADAGSGKVEGTLNLRNHVAVIDVPYSASSYSILFKRGENLDVAEGRIHKNYNGWVQNLDRAIRTEISRL